MLAVLSNMKQALFFILAIIFVAAVVYFAKSYIFVTQKSRQSATIKTVEQTKKHSMKITSVAFPENQNIPAKFTCTGEDINPALTFSEVPHDAASLVLIMDDPDAPMGTFVHWVVYNMKPTVTGIPENTKPEGTEGKNGAGKRAYAGPCPPSGTHHYHFKLYALDAELEFPDPESVDKKAVEEKMQGHILDQAELIGLFSK
jgi:Raf kinase inhibitor-like YbhB/YbcL family protein